MHVPDLGPARWVKSSYSTNTSNCVEVAALPAWWAKSSYSSNTSNCVEVGAARAAGNRSALAVRDSKNPAGPALVLPAAHWTTFVTALRAGEWLAGS